MQELCSDKKELCLGKERAVLEIKESCAWDKKELCTDKTVGAPGGLSGHFLRGIFTQKIV